MPQILFKKEFKPAILKGRKTTTLRRWKKCNWKAGDRVNAPGVGVLVLHAVEPVEWSALTEADAHSDGFESLAELNKAIKKIYGDLRGDGKTWFRLSFKLASAGRMRQLAEALRGELDKAV